MASSTPKSTHYHQQLSAALTAGAWTTEPCAAKYGSTAMTLSWNELIRKWGKHCAGSSTTATALLHQLHDLSVAYLSSRTPLTASPESDVSALSSAGSFVHVSHGGAQAVAPSGRGVTASELDGDDDVHSGRWWAGVVEEKRMHLREVVTTLQAAAGSGSESERHSTQLLLAYHLHALGEHTQALQVYSTINWTLQGIIPNDASLVDHIRGRCLQGISLELQPSPAPSLAIDTYIAAADLLPASSPFNQWREAHRFVSRALSRAAVICLRTAASPQRCKTILERYHSIARLSKWPTNFNPRQRAAMLKIYLGVLESDPEADEQGLVDAVGQGMDFLGATTEFPRAGETNILVQDFAIRVTGIYEAHPSAALRAKAISVQWWAMQLTYHSQPVLRQLVFLLTAPHSTTEEHQDAKRCFELYVRLVLKARQIEHGTGDDDEKTFVKALVHGARILVVLMGEPEEAWRYVVLAGERGVLVETVEEAKGIVRSAMALYGAEAVDRPVYQAQAINHLKAATTTSTSNADALYHLSYAHASAREIEPAITAIRSALELEPLHIQSWHLLALLLSAQGDWFGAERALDVGVRVWDEADADADVGDEMEVLENQEGVEVRDFAQRAPAPSKLLKKPVKRPNLKAGMEMRMTAVVVAERLHGWDVALERQQELFLFFSTRAPIPVPVAAKAESIRELSGSFVTVTDSAPGPKGLGESMISVHPPDSSVTTDSSPAVSDHETDGGEKQSTSGKKRHFLPRHLHVPSGSGGSSLGRSKSVKSTGNLPIERQRTISAASTAPPTIAHSHYRGNSSNPAPPPPPPVVSDAKRLAKSPFETRILSRLWLMSAATFRRAGKLEQALGAIQEAEVMDPENPDVWVQLGLYHVATSSPSLALPAFSKAMLLKPDYPPTVVSLAKLYLSTGSIELAHSLLNQLTQSTGWDVPEAWYYLAKVCEAQGGRAERARECLVYALELEKSRPCRALGEAVEAWII